MRKSLTREELSQKQLQSKHHWAEVGVRKPANTPTSAGSYWDTKAETSSPKPKRWIFGPLFGSGDFRGVSPVAGNEGLDSGRSIRACGGGGAGSRFIGNGN